MAGFLIPAICFSADLTTNSGKTYKNYSVRRVTEKGIQIMHAQGGCIVPFEQLPDDVRAKYRSQDKKISDEQRQKKTPETEKPQLSRPVQKEIIPAVDRESMLQIKILTSDWSNPTSDMLDGMVENDLIKPWILPMVDGMQKYYPPKWDMSLLKKAGKCVFEMDLTRGYKSDEPGQFYIAGKITPEIAKISLIFQVDKWEDRYEFVIYASENESHVENAKGFYLAALKFYDLSKRYKSGSKKSKREEIKIVRGEYGYGSIGIDFDFNFYRKGNGPFRLHFYGYSGRKEKEILYVKMSGKQFSRLSLALLYAFDKLANHHLKRHYWVRNKQTGQKNNNAAK